MQKLVATHRVKDIVLLVLITTAIFFAIIISNNMDLYAGENTSTKDTLPPAEEVGEYRKDGYPVPDVTGLKPVKQFVYNRDKTNPDKETLVRLYYTREGGRAFVLSHHGRVYCIGIDHDRFKPADYEVVDIDGVLVNGKQTFEVKIFKGQKYQHPSWLK